MPPPPPLAHPPRTVRHSGPARERRGESGQAAVELVAVLPLVALLLALAWQAVLAGHAAWAATAAARAAARAAALAQAPLPVARARLDGGLAAGAQVHDDGAGHVTVSVRVPSVVPGLDLGRIEGQGSFRRQDGSS
jgi:Flp pilus assembly protein TadG